MRPRLLIVDDHEGFREAASALLAAEGFDVVGLAEDGEQAVVEAARLRPDVVLLDVQLPGSDGFAIAELLAAPGGPAVVLISSHDATTYGARLDTTSARGFLPKRELTGAALAALVG